MQTVPRSFALAQPADLAAFEESVRPGLEAAATLEEAAQAMARGLCESFHPGVLVRLYQTVRYHQLPAPVRELVRTRAAARNAAERVHGMTPVLALMGTHGVEEDWRDRIRSKGHQGIPLLDARFVESIPMVARLLQELGLGLDFFDARPGVATKKLIGGLNGVFYVADAATAVDDRGRLIIPAQDFVAKHRVQTVFGMGGVYLPGSMICAIVFTGEHVSRAQAERFARTISLFKAATLRLVRQNLLFRGGGAKGSA